MDKKKKIFDFLHSQTHAVVSTVSSSNKPEAAWVGFGEDENLILVFGTNSTSRKAKNILQNQNVAVTVSDDTKTVQLEGTATILEGDELVRLKKYISQKLLVRSSMKTNKMKFILKLFPLGFGSLIFQSSLKGFSKLAFNMRIGIDCRLWSESGVGRYTRNLVGYLQKIDTKNEYILFVLSKDLEQIKSEIKNSKFEIVRADIRWHSFEEQWKFSTVLVQQKLDLVHFPYFSLPVSYPGKFIVTIHDLILHHFPTGQASTLNPLFYWIKLLGYKYIVYKAAKKAKRIITVTEATKKEIVQHLGITPQKIEVTYEGIDRKISTKSEASNLQKNPNYF